MNVPDCTQHVNLCTLIFPGIWHENTKVIITDKTIFTLEDISNLHKNTDYRYCMCTGISSSIPFNVAAASVYERILGVTTPCMGAYSDDKFIMW